MILASICIVVGWIVVAGAHPRSTTETIEYVIIGLLLGTLFGQATLAAAWTAFGSGILRRRVALSIMWIFALGLSFVLNMARSGGGRETVAVIATCLAGQWLLVQIPLWGLVLWYRVCLRHVGDEIATVNPRFRQFGIGQLMALTALVAVLLGIGRIVMPWLARSVGPNWGELIIFGFLTVAGIVMTLPLLLASLLPRYAIMATLLVTMLIALGTGLELSLLTQLAGARGGPDAGHLAAINAIQGGWIVLIAGLMRHAGYVLRTSEPSLAPGALGQSAATR